MSKIFLPCPEVAQAQVCASDIFTWNWIPAHSSQSLVYTVLKSGVCAGKPGGALSHCPSWATCVSHFLQKDWIPAGWGSLLGMGRMGLVERTLAACHLPRDRTTNSSKMRCLNGKPAPFPVNKQNVWYLPMAGLVDISIEHQLKFQSNVELYSQCT